MELTYQLDRHYPRRKSTSTLAKRLHIAYKEKREEQTDQSVNKQTN